MAYIKPRLRLRYLKFPLWAQQENGGIWMVEDGHGRWCTAGAFDKWFKENFIYDQEKNRIFYGYHLSNCTFAGIS